MIPCSELNQTKAYLLQQFKNCKALKAEDMQLFVNYVYSIGLCVETDDGFVDLSYIPAEDQGTIANTAGTDAIVPLATQQYAGLFSPQEKLILESLVIDGLIYPGIVSWSGVGLIYDVSQALIKLGGTPYLIETDQVTLAASDPTNPRIDVVYASPTGFGVLTGTPAAEPIMPQVDPSTQVFLTSIIVAPNTTQPEPGDITTEDIYQENQEWTISSVGTGTTNPESPSFPFVGTYAIETTNIQAGYLLNADKGSDFTYTDYDTISFRIRLKSPLSNTQSLTVYLVNSNGGKVTQGITLQLNKLLIDQYQFVAININEFSSSTTNQARSVAIRYMTEGGSSIHSGFFVDDWKIQGGIEQPSPVVNEHDELQGIKGNGTFHLSEEERDKLAEIEAGAEVNVNADWDATSGDAQILNKPNIPTKTSDLTNDSEFITLNDIPSQYFTYEQTTPSDKWTIEHPLGRKVSVTVTDSAGTVMEGQVTLNTGTEIEIQFNVPFWGYAYLI